MLQVSGSGRINFKDVEVDPFWTTGSEPEMKMHRIHAYPAKFPSFITTKTLELAEQEKISVNSIADVFCGCGTVAYEAHRNKMDFWGCDINPVATLIAKVKSEKYESFRIDSYREKILSEYEKQKQIDVDYKGANERLKYWYSWYQYKSLEVDPSVETIIH